MIYRVPQQWIDRRRRFAPIAGVSVAVLAIAGVALSMLPRVDWTNPQQAKSAVIIIAVVAVGLGLGLLAGRASFRSGMRRWQSFEVELTNDELIRQMDGQETRIQRANVSSIREFPRRGLVITDNLGWRIFVPNIIENYADFRERVIAWGAPLKAR